MKLLIITQVVDKEHPILGFFHRWLEEFAKHVDTLHVICLEEGRHTLPVHVHVHSLGKEKGRGRLSYVLEFYRLIFSLRHEYDRVFVHMNQVYVLLGAPLWRLFSKRVDLWYMHGSVTPSLKVAEKLVTRVFTGSKESFRINSNKVVVTGHGIDTARFAPQTAPKTTDLITVGRIAPAKNLHTLIEIFREIKNDFNDTLTIVGAAVTDIERTYEKTLKEKVVELGLQDSVIFAGAVPQAQLPEVLNSAKVFVTVAQNGSLDKAVLEAMACDLPVVSMAPGTASLPLGTAQTATREVFTQELKKVLESGTLEKPEYAAYVQEQHSLSTLIPKILST